MPKENTKTTPALDPIAEQNRLKAIRADYRLSDRCDRVSVNGYRCARLGKTTDVRQPSGAIGPMQIGCEENARNCEDCEQYKKP